MARLSPSPGGSSPFTAPETLPQRQLSVSGPVLVVAPHPDDETLGCGGALALLRAQSLSVRVLVVSDGTQSHPRSRLYPGPQLRQLREAETLAALALLGVPRSHVTFLGLPDGRVPHLGLASPGAAAAALGQCQQVVERVAPRTIFLPYQFDPHRDHRATWSLVQRAIAVLPQPPRLIEYPIWDWDLQRRQPLNAQYQAWRLNIAPYVEIKHQAIACYRSQTTDLIADDPTGFRLSSAMMACFLNPWEIFLEQTP
ncbi:PIG-L family deacetylase [Nodosilinea sp. LEGE 07088]|uniref:PIG-L deacetylase family protein n=1 Tax=Nodosilinea sp. LEGE 07088 TaxID=2777968 RepID=UPI00187E48F0|nr:PIG-L deacetylase family protein [Nodosilinea sp. LEGE 07088]MBE9137634.1 PIG-L family deacetylase [Nodosilinea sp. LEGE 07088]